MSSENEIEDTAAANTGATQDADKLSRLQEVEMDFVTRREACEMLGIRATNTAKALDHLATYEIFGRILYASEDVDALAAQRMNKDAERVNKRQEALLKMQESMNKATERAQALAEKIKLARGDNPTPDDSLEVSI